MYQALLDRFSDVLFPVVCALLLWFGVHYFFLTERIMKVEMPVAYETMATQTLNLPDSVHECLKDNIAGATLDVARFDAAVYTASLRHISRPFHKSSIAAIDHLDTQCGTTKALEAEKECLRLAAEEKERQEKERALALAEKKKREAERLAKQAAEEARKKQAEMYCNAAGMFLGRRVC